MNINEYNRISQCEMAKYIWRLLKINHEDTNQVKEFKINIFVQNYELFSIKGFIFFIGNILLVVGLIYKFVKQFLNYHVVAS